MAALFELLLLLETLEQSLPSDVSGRVGLGVVSSLTTSNLLEKTSFDSLRNVLVKLRDASASVPGLRAALLAFDADVAAALPVADVREPE